MLNRRLLTMALVLVIASAGLGIVIGMNAGPQDGPLTWMKRSDGRASASSVDTIAQRPGVVQARAADEHIEFPEALQDLPGYPRRLVSDDKGDLWFVLIQATSDSSNQLYRYDKETKQLSSFVIPAGGGSPLFHDVLLDPRGHIVVADGEVIVDFDPATESFRTIPISAPTDTKATGGPAGTWITDATVTGNGTIALARANTSAITDVDLRTGMITEYPIQDFSGEIYAIEALGDGLLVSSPLDAEGRPGWSAFLDLGTGRLARIDGVITETTTAERGSLFAISRSAGVVKVESGGPNGPVILPVSDESTATAVSGVAFTEALAIDAGRRALWLASESQQYIVRVDVESGETTRFRLPSYEMDRVFCPHLGDDLDCEARISVDSAAADIAVSAAGTVFFSDVSFPRIGVIFVADGRN